jgi:NDP-sugar pyrophosphorylase family protein
MRARRIDAVPVVDADGRPVGLHLLQQFLEPVIRTNWAVIMAGGQGTRLRPLTDHLPKPMLTVAGRPIIERLVLHLVGFGLKRIFVAVNYLGDVIEEHLGDGTRLGARVAYLREDEPLGTAGALGLLPEPPTEPLLLLNGDLVTSADLGGLLDAHVEGGYRATFGTRRYLHTVPFGTIERDGDRVVRLDEKPTLEREVNSGICALDPSVVARVLPGRRIDTPDLIADLLASGEPVGAFEIEDEWIDVGQREQLAAARGVAT